MAVDSGGLFQPLNLANMSSARSWAGVAWIAPEAMAHRCLMNSAREVGIGGGVQAAVEAEEPGAVVAAGLAETGADGADGVDIGGEE